MFVLRHKFDIVVKFRQLRALIKNDISKMIKHVQTNSSIEICSELLYKFCIEEA